MSNGTVTTQWEKINVNTLEVGTVTCTLSMTAPTPDGKDDQAVTTVGYVTAALADVAMATEDKAGYMSAADKRKLDAIEDSSNRYVHPVSSVVPGTYMTVTVNNLGHVIAGERPTTLAGYGIVDAQPAHVVLSSLVETVEGAEKQGSILTTSAHNLVDRIPLSPTVAELLRAETPAEIRTLLNIPVYSSTGLALATVASPAAASNLLGLPAVSEVGQALMTADSAQAAREAIGALSTLALEDLITVEYDELTEEFSVPVFGAYGRIEAEDGYICLGKYFGGLMIYWQNAGASVRIGFDRSIKHDR